MRIAPNGDSCKYRDLEQPHILSLEEMIVGCQIISAGSLMRKSSWDKYGGFDLRYPQAQDYDLWLRMLAGGEKLVMTHESVYFYFTNPRSVSANPMRNLRSTKKILSNFTGEQVLSLEQKKLAEKVVRDKAIRAKLAAPLEGVRKILRPLLGDRGDDFFFKLYTAAATLKRRLRGAP
jgi:hypothetical protein